MELDQLRYFLQVADEANFTRAAETLRLSQPALSRSIAKLEDELGQPLLERQSRRVILTEAGTLLRSRAREVLRIIDNTVAEICDDGQTGTIQLGAIPTIAPFFLPGLLAEFATRFPAARLIVQEDTTENLLKACSQGDVDLAILALPLNTKYLEVEPLFDEELLLVLPADHTLTGKETIEIADIDHLPFILLGEAHCLSDHVVSFCRRKSFHPVSVERTSQMATVLELVAMGHGISMIPKMARNVDESERRVYRSLHPDRPLRTVAMAWNPYRFQSRLLNGFRDVVRDYACGTADQAAR